MVDLISIYNKATHVPIKILTDDTVFTAGIMQVAVENVNTSFNTACSNLIMALNSNDMSEAMERVGIALRTTYDNARVMIDMFNHIVEETGNHYTRRNNEQERQMGTSTEST